MIELFEFDTQLSSLTRYHTLNSVVRKLTESRAEALWKSFRDWRQRQLNDEQRSLSPDTIQPSDKGAYQQWRQEIFNSELARRRQFTGLNHEDEDERCVFDLIQRGLLLIERNRLIRRRDQDVQLMNQAIDNRDMTLAIIHGEAAMNTGEQIIVIGDQLTMLWRSEMTRIHRGTIEFQREINDRLHYFAVSLFQTSLGPLVEGGDMADQPEEA